LSLFNELKRRNVIRVGMAYLAMAVLPLVNLSGNPDEEYFADGMTEALITNLAKISAMRIVSRTSIMRFKGSPRL
jgi:TolB-like protein